MAKIKVVYDRSLASFDSDWMRPMVNKFIEFEPRDSSRNYPRGTGFYINCLDLHRFNTQQLAEQGFKVIVDHLWEIIKAPIAHAHVVSNTAWLWYNESLWYRHLGYHEYQPQRNIKYKALMPMNLMKKHRTDFLQALGSLTDQMMWSYVATGRQLPNDGDMTDWDTQRRFNPEWYDSCYMSMVVETCLDTCSAHTPILISEKTFKPIAFQHPLMVYGNSGTLKTLRQWGFETFDNLWDESYDLLTNSQQRRNAIVKLLHEVEIKDYDTETQQRLAHNHAHFFDTELVNQRIREEILEPLLNYAET